jgi:D-arabinose 1-dehydrogenase-like Zn-dependent alcohol dehydrogenase
MSTEGFKGWVCHGPDSIQGNMKWEDFTPKQWTEDDVEFDVIACGICHSDLHTMSNGWKSTNYPAVVGHEIVGKVTRVGSNVKHLKVGDRAAVGAQSDSCHECNQCKDGRESYCDKMQGTYNGNHLDGKGRSMGGYANKWRGPAHFAIPLPDGLDAATAGCMACGGITIFSPLQDYGCGTKDVKRIGIVGAGGIGHMGIVFAKAMGAEQIVVISSTSGKKELSQKLGATDFVAMSEDPKGLSKFRRSLDLIIVTANNHDQPFDKYLWTLRPRGHLINIAVPEQPAMPIPIGALLFSGASIGGSAIGGTEQIKHMFQFAADKKLEFMIEKRSMKDANAAVVDMKAGKPRFRYALMNE